MRVFQVGGKNANHQW